MRIQFAVLVSLALVLPILTAPVARDDQTQDLAAAVGANETVPSVFMGDELSPDFGVAESDDLTESLGDDFDEAGDEDEDDGTLEARAKTKKVAKPKAVVKKPVAKKVTKPVPKKVAKPAPKKVAKPAPKKVAKPAPKKVAKPASKKVAKPATKKVTKPTTKKVAKPTTKKVAKPATKKVTKPTTKKVAKPTTKKVPAKTTAKKVPPKKVPTKKVTAKKPVKKVPTKSKSASASPTATFVFPQPKKIAGTPAHKTAPNNIVLARSEPVSRDIVSRKISPTVRSVHDKRKTVSVFHGTCGEFVDSITKELKIPNSDPGDFSYKGGLYFTDSFEQAKRFILSKGGCSDGSFVLEFTFNDAGLTVEDLRGLTTAQQEEFNTKNGEIAFVNPASNPDIKSIVDKSDVIIGQVPVIFEEEGAPKNPFVQFVFQKNGLRGLTFKPPAVRVD